MNCIFCDIVNGKAPSEIIFEDEHVLGFLDIRPLNYGHSLVIPKIHFENFLDVPKSDLESVVAAAQKISEAIKLSMNTDGLNIVANTGRAAGQTVFHFHFHIIPRFNSDDFHFKPVFKNYENGLMKELADKIRKAVK
jgi:histidine triad (HIT) family protein